MQKEFETWCIKQNIKNGNDAKLTKEDKIISGLFFKTIPKILMFLLIVSLAMRGYEKYGIERTMIVISWIFIYSTSQNLSKIRKTTNTIMQNQMKFFQNYDKRKETEENLRNAPIPKSTK